MNKLCSTCLDLFHGHWIKRPPSANSISGSESATYDEASDETSQDQFYEQPDWVKVSEGSARGYEPAPHHSIPGLQISAGQGCHLCSLIADKIPKDHTGHENSDAELWQLLKQNSGRLIGVVVVRPYAEDDIEQQDLCLEVSYWLDGDSDNTSAYFLTVDLELCKVAGKLNCHIEQKKKLSTLNSSPSEYAPVDLAAPVRTETLESVNTWASKCIADHDLCQEKVKRLHDVNTSFKHPTRLLEMAILDNGQYFLRVCQSHTLREETRYVTLSHCWGKSPPFRLLVSNQEEYSSSIPISDLPRTFREGVEFTIRLGLRYIWIDALCIIQDSDEDWLRESLLMASVYSHSYVNLAATASADGEGALFVAENPYLANPCVIQTTWAGLPPGTYMCVDDNAWSRNINKAPLNQRAWVLQERLLAPRTVHFARDQVWWDCCEVRACESFPYGRPEERVPIKTDVITEFQGITSDDPETSRDAWLNIVQEYSACKLTKRRDKLIALTGIAKAVQATLQASDDDYLAGLWRGGIAVDLLWRLVGCGVRSEEKVAPSWSWASVEGEVHWNPSGIRVQTPKRLSLELVDIQVNVTQAGTFGSLEGGHVLVAAHLYPVVLSEPDTTTIPGGPFMKKLMINNHQFLHDDTFTETLDHDPLYSQCPEGGIAAFFCLFATSLQPALEAQYMSEGLLLEHELAQKGTYRRIGLLRIFHLDTPEQIQGRLNGPMLANNLCLNMDAEGRHVIRIV